MWPIAVDFANQDIHSIIVQGSSNINDTDFFTNVKPHLARYWPWKGKVSTFPSLSGSCELVQSCLSSTREMSEQKVSVSVEQRILIKFLTSEVVQPSEIFQRLEKQFGDACLSKTRVFEWCKIFREGKRKWKTRRIIVDREHQSPHPILFLSILIFVRTQEHQCRILPQNFLGRSKG